MMRGLLWFGTGILIGNLVLPRLKLPSGQTTANDDGGKGTEAAEQAGTETDVNMAGEFAEVRGLRPGARCYVRRGRGAEMGTFNQDMKCVPHGEVIQKRAVPIRRKGPFVRASYRMGRAYHGAF